MGKCIFSQDGLYRFRLERAVSAEGLSRGPAVCFVMLNPSTADEMNDDPTIRRCIGFARRLVAARLIVVNLFAYRATDPRELLVAADPTGTRNADHIAEARRDSEITIVAWGANAAAKRANKGCLDAATNPALGKVVALGFTKDGSPRHPLYAPGNAAFVPYPSPAPGKGGGA